MGKRIAIVLLLLPAAEVVVFLLVAWAIGFFPTLGLMILTSFAGAVVLSRAGHGQIAHIRAAVRRGGIVEGTAEERGLLRALGGILLLLPGFVTDLVGAGLLVGPIRWQLYATIRRAIGARRSTTGPGSVIDLAPDEWQAVPDQDRPKTERR